MQEEYPVNDETGYQAATNSAATSWGDPMYCGLCRKAVLHSYRKHEIAVHATRVARMED